MCWVMPPASFAHHVGVPDRVEQLGLAVVDVTHDGDHRRPGHQVGLLALVLAELDVERLQQLPVLFLRGDHLNVVVQLGAEQLQRLVVHRLGGGDHLAEVEEHLHERGRVHADLVGEVAQRRAAGQPDDLAVAARDLHAADRRRLHVVELLAALLLRLAAARRPSAWPAERALRTAAGRDRRRPGAPGLMPGRGAAAAAATAGPAPPTARTRTAAAPPPGAGARAGPPPGRRRRQGPPGPPRAAAHRRGPRAACCSGWAAGRRDGAARRAGAASAGPRGPTGRGQPARGPPWPGHAGPPGPAAGWPGRCRAARRGAHAGRSGAERVVAGPRPWPRRTGPLAAAGRAPGRGAPPPGRGGAGLRRRCRAWPGRGLPGRGAARAWPAAPPGWAGGNRTGGGTLAAGAPAAARLRAWSRPSAAAAAGPLAAATGLACTGASAVHGPGCMPAPARAAASSARGPLAGPPDVPLALGRCRGPATQPPGRLAPAWPLACELILEPADYRRLDRRGRRPHKLAHLLELGHHGLALYPELLREFVYPDLRHYAPSTSARRTGPASRPGQRVLRPASACGVHRRLLIGRSSQSQPAFSGPACRSSVCPSCPSSSRQP